MHPVPPFWSRTPATFRITSFAEAQPDRRPVSLIPMSWGTQFPRHAGHHVHSVGTADTHGHHAQSRHFTVCESVPIIMPPGNA